MSKYNKDNEIQLSDLAQALKILVSYMNNKGQLPRLDKFILFELYIKSLCELYGCEEKEIIDIDKLVKEYSINAPAFEKPLWLIALSELAKLNQKTEIVTQLSKRKELE